MNRFLTSRLAAKVHIHGTETEIRAERAARRVDRLIVQLWKVLTSRLAVYADRSIFFFSIARLLITDLKQSARWSHRQTSNSLRAVLPLTYLKAAARRRFVGEARLLEKGPGIVEIGLQVLGLQAPEDPFAEPVGDDIGADRQFEALANLLFPPASQEQIDRIIFAPYAGRTWLDQWRDATRLTDQPGELAKIVSQGMAQGKGAREIAKELVPLVDGVRNSARRIARTATIQVAHEIQHETFEGLGKDLVTGYQVRATLDEHTRPWHRSRSGTIYYRSPGPGQKGFYQMPHPPLEAADPGERPAGAPQTAWN